jgi:hypothetical protein
MSDDEKRLPGGGLKRVSHKDRKTRLVSGPLFPDDADEKSNSEETPLEPWERGDDPPPLFTAQEEASEKELIPAPPAERFPPLPHEFAQPPGVKKPATARQKPVKKRRHGNWRHNFVAFLFLIGTVALVIGFAWIWTNTYNPSNPLALATPYKEVTETPVPVAAVNTLAPAQDTETPIPPTNTPFIPSPDRPFTLVESGVIYAPNANGRGCDWASIAGTVTGLQSQPLSGYGVQIVDAQDPSRLDIKVFSGSALTFGAGSFELILNNAPVQGQYIIQLFSPAGAPVSEEALVFTHDSCNENVAVVNFVQVADI